MRSVLVDWLIGVHMQFKLLPETVYTAVAILDRYKMMQNIRYSDTYAFYFLFIEFCFLLKFW